MTKKGKKQKKKKESVLAKVFKKVKGSKKPEGPKIVMNADGIPLCPHDGVQCIFKGHRRYFKGKGKKKEAAMERSYKCPSCGEFINIPS